MLLEQTFDLAVFVLKQLISNLERNVFILDFLLFTMNQIQDNEDSESNNLYYEIGC